MTNKESSDELEYSEVILCYFLVSLVLLIEVRIIQLTLNGGMSVPISMAIHAGVVALLGFWTLRLHRFGHGLHFPALLTIFTSVLGPFGIVGTLASTGLHNWFKKSSTPFSEWYQSIFPDHENPKMRNIFDQAESTRDFHLEKQPVIPFYDVLHYGTTKQKQAMIVLLIDHHHGKFAGVLRKALEDKDGSVRVLAAKGMAKIEQSHMDRNMELENKYRSGNISRFEMMKSRILNNDDYVYSGILDESRETDIRRNTIQACKEYLGQYPDDLDIRFIVGRMLLRGGNESNAAGWYEDCLRQGFKSPKIFSWYFECLFRMGQFAKLREQSEIYFQEIEQFKHVFQPDVFQVIKIWADSQSESLKKSRSLENVRKGDTLLQTGILGAETA